MNTPIFDTLRYLANYCPFMEWECAVMSQSDGHVCKRDHLTLIGLTD